MQRELVERARGGDADAFAALQAACADTLHGICYRILRDADLAADALQQALIAIWDHLPELREAERFDAWAYRLCVRASLREARRHRRWEVRPIWPVEPTVADAVELTADRDLLERGFLALTPEQRAVLVLRFYVDLPIQEIATSLGIPSGTVRSRLHHATRSLRAALEAEDRSPIHERRPA